MFTIYYLLLVFTIYYLVFTCKDRRRYIRERARNTSLHYQWYLYFLFSAQRTQPEMNQERTKFQSSFDCTSSAICGVRRSYVATDPPVKSTSAFARVLETGTCLSYRRLANDFNYESTFSGWAMHLYARILKIFFDHGNTLHFHAMFCGVIKYIQILLSDDAINYWSFS